jgi:hypothetical protein
MYEYMKVQIVESYKLQLFRGRWFLKWHSVLPADGTLVPKHVGNATLILY